MFCGNVPLLESMKTMDRLGTSVEYKKIAMRESAEWFAGISRHGIVAAERAAKGPRARTSFRLFMAQLSGSVLIGLGVSLFVHARLGVPAYDVMLTALRDRFRITLGQAGWVFTSILFVLTTVLGRRPRVNSLVYMFANGLAVDLWMPLIEYPANIAMRVLFVVLGTVSIAGGVALVIHAGLSGSAIELLSLVGEDHGFDQFKARRAIELFIVLGGVVLGGDIGIATVFFVLTMSVILKAGRQALADHQAGRTARLAA